MRLEKIENWYLQRTQPSFKDAEGVTAIDMVGKNTAKINEIIELVNAFTKEMETYIKEFTESTNKDYEAFKTSINQKIVDFIEVVDLKLASQDKEITDFTEEVSETIETQNAHIDETITYIRENLTGYITENVEQILRSAVEEGTLDEAIMNGVDGLQGQINTINSTLEGKANTSDVYTKGEVDTSLNSKANQVDVYTKGEVDEIIAGIEVSGGGSTEPSGSTGDRYEIRLNASGNSNGELNTEESLGIISELINKLKADDNQFHEFYVRFKNASSSQDQSGFWRPVTNLRNNPTQIHLVFNKISYSNGFVIPTVYYMSLKGTWTNDVFTCNSVTYSEQKNKYIMETSSASYTFNRIPKCTESPSANTDLTTKQYVDGKVTELNNKIHGCYNGTSEPDTSIGVDGDVYFQYIG